MYKPAMKTKRTNPDFVNGVPELLMLSLLARRPMYGYEIVQAIRQSTRGILEFGEGCVYPILHRLEAEGLLGSKRETVGGRSRVVYRVTARGSKPRQHHDEGGSRLSKPSTTPWKEANMANLPWLEEVQKRLYGHGLPPSYVRRFVAELMDHFQDLKEENMGADAVSRLGEPEAVAEAAVTAYRRRSFFARHPVLTFPLPLLVFAVSPVVSYALLFFSFHAPCLLHRLFAPSWDRRYGVIGLGVCRVDVPRPGGRGGTRLPQACEAVLLEQAVDRRFLSDSCHIGSAAAHTLAAYDRRPDSRGEPPLLPTCEAVWLG